MQAAHQMGHSKIETTKNIYGHLSASDQSVVLDAMNQAVSSLHAYEIQGAKNVAGHLANPTDRGASNIAVAGVDPC
jgi:hypothetical protein